MCVNNIDYDDIKKNTNYNYFVLHNIIQFIIIHYKLNLFLKNISYKLIFYVYDDVVFKIYA